MYVCMYVCMYNSWLDFANEDFFKEAVNVDCRHADG